MRMAFAGWSLVLTVLGCLTVGGQNFVNLTFDRTTITNAPFGNNIYLATIPGWTWTPQYNFGFYNTSNLVSLNEIALDAPVVTLQGTDSPFFPAIQGRYSVLLQGGSSIMPSTSYAAIGQTGQIPVTALSLTFWGGALQVTFNGQPLALTAVGFAPNYTLWAADIAPYAGQTGRLLFTAPWQTTALLDNIQFSSTPLPEPGPFALSLGGLALLSRRTFHRPSAAPRPGQ